jgi:hypothetical protein
MNLFQPSVLLQREPELAGLVLDQADQFADCLNPDAFQHLGLLGTWRMARGIPDCYPSVLAVRSRESMPLNPTASMRKGA